MGTSMRGLIPTLWEYLFLFHEAEQTGPIVRVTLGATRKVERKRNDDGGTLATPQMKKPYVALHLKRHCTSNETETSDWADP